MPETRRRKKILIKTWISQELLLFFRNYHKVLIATTAESLSYHNAVERLHAVANFVLPLVGLIRKNNVSEYSKNSEQCQLRKPVTALSEMQLSLC